MFGVGPTEIAVVLVLAVLIFGPSQIPRIGRAIGQSIREVKNIKAAVNEGISDTADTVNTVKKELR